MATLNQKTSFGPGIYRGHSFSIDRLKAFVEGTNKAIAAGVPIPLLKRHAPINASDSETSQFAQEEGSGWVKKVSLDDNGHIAWEADSVPDHIANDIKTGTIKFTSPEFRPHYECEKAGVYSGPVIRHFAFTSTPGNPHQGDIEVSNENIALSELTETIQLSEADYQGPIQFTESFTHRLLKNKGWNKGNSGYFHKKLKDHTITVNPEGGWTHTTPTKNKFTGKSHKDLETHIRQWPTQHTENPVEQFSEEYDSILSKHAFKKHSSTSSIGTSKYSKGKHTVHVSKEGNWEHYHKGELKSAGGFGKDLDDYLGSRQYAEYPKHDEDAEDDEDTGVDDFGKSEGESIDDEELVSGEKKPKKKKGTENKDEDVAKEQSMDKEANEAANKADGQYAEKNSDGFGKPDNDEPNAPAKQAPNDPNLEVMENPEAPIEATPENPDMPPKATDKTKLSAIIAGLNQLGVVVPSDWDPCKDGAMDILLGCLNTHIKTEQDAEVKESAEQEDTEDPKDAPMPFSEDGHTHTMREAREHFYKMDSQDSGEHSITHKGKTIKGTPRQVRHYLHDQMDAGEPYEGAKKQVTLHASQYTEDTTQFSEEELAALTPKARAVIEAGQKALETERKAKEEAEAKAIQYAEQEKQTRAMAAKGRAIAEVTACVIPPALKQQILNSYQSVQFSEGNDQPLFTGEQVAKMVANSLPPALQFLEAVEGGKPSVSIEAGINPDGSKRYIDLENAEQFFEKGNTVTMTADRANEIANATVAKQVFHHRGSPTFTPTVPISERVSLENARVPNNVMRQ